MRDKFFPYYMLTEDTLSNIWDKAFIVIDANVLLNTYKMDSEARKQFFEVFKFSNIHAKLWMPYQVGWEFIKNRKEAIDATVNALIDVQRDIKKKIESLKSSVEKSGLRFHEDFMNLITDELKNLQTKLNELFEGYHKFDNKSDYYNKGQLKESDSITDTVAEIYKDKIGERFSQEELFKFYEVGQFRFDLLIPPGFEDVIKGDYRNYGDFIIWEEMKKKASESERPIIFVTEDHKKDWWLKDHKNNLKPQPHLLAEFRTETKQYFYMYTYKEFIVEAKKRYAELPDTDKVTKQMDLAAEEHGTVKEEIELPSVAVPAIRVDDPHMIHLQSLMNHANPAVANRAYKEYIEKSGVFPRVFNEAMARAHTLARYNTGKALNMKSELDYILERSDIPESKKLELLQNILGQIQHEIDFYDVQGY